MIITYLPVGLAGRPSLVGTRDAIAIAMTFWCKHCFKQCVVV